MPTAAMPYLTILAAIGSGLMAGLFFAFSNSVMPALARMPVPRGVAAMNHVNAVIQNPLFFLIFFGTALVSLVLLGAALLGMAPRPGWLVAGALLYLAGNIAVTVAVNVPLNNALAAAAADPAASAQVWAVYLDRWVWWNHIRAVACTGAMVAFVVALM